MNERNLCTALKISMIETHARLPFEGKLSAKSSNEVTVIEHAPVFKHLILNCVSPSPQGEGFGCVPLIYSSPGAIPVSSRIIIMGIPKSEQAPVFKHLILYCEPPSPQGEGIKCISIIYSSPGAIPVSSRIIIMRMLKEFYSLSRGPGGRAPWSVLAGERLQMPDFFIVLGDGAVAGEDA
jgi:hypothetical protein